MSSTSNPRGMGFELVVRWAGQDTKELFNCDDYDESENLISLLGGLDAGTVLNTNHMMAYRAFPLPLTVPDE